MKRKKVLAVAAIICSVLISACGAKQDSGVPAPDRDTSVYSKENAGETEDGETESGKAESDETESAKSEETNDLAECGVGSEKGTKTAQAAPELKTDGNTAKEPAQGGSSGSLLKGASPETSAMTFYAYDGKTAQISYMFDSEKVQEILDSLNAVKEEKAEGWTADDASLPVYGIEIGGEDGLSIFAAWTNGHWIAQDGTVYRFDFDFGQLAQRYEWEKAGELPSFTSFPCARLFTQEKNRWNTRFLIPAAPLNPPEGLNMKLESWDQDTAVVSISNGSSEEWSCGEFFEIQALIDHTWYEVPTMPGNWGFNCVGFYVPVGGTQSMINHLAMYGELPPGKYRLVLKELWVEHEIR